MAKESKRLDKLPAKVSTLTTAPTPDKNFDAFTAHCGEDNSKLCVSNTSTLLCWVTGLSYKAQKFSINVELISDNYRELKGEIAGPPDTPYEGGTFLLEIKVPETYPFNPPKVKFLTRVWHPNISSVTGAICLDILKDQWAAAMTLRTVLLSLQALLATPEPDDPQDAVVAKQYRDNYPLYIKTAEFWTFFYAGASKKNNDEFSEKVRHVKDMGVTENQALVALSSCHWEMARAIDQLFS